MPTLPPKTTAREPLSAVGRPTGRERAQAFRRERALRAARYASPLRYNPVAARYVDGTGTFVPFGSVRVAYDEALASAGREVRALTEGLRDGRVSLLDWRAEMGRVVKDVQLVSAALVRGGFERMSPADYGRVGARVRRELGYLERFTQQIASGADGASAGQPLDGRALRRAQMYVEAGRGSVYEERRAAAAERGFDEERSVLGAAEHCPECEAEKDRGWVPLGSLVPIGGRACLANCQCHIEIRRTADGALYGE